jgi:hypothetical protein
MAAPIGAQWINYPTPGVPRTPDGKPNLTAPVSRTPDDKPDLSGLWALTMREGGVTQLNPAEIKPWALKLAKQREETLGQDSPGVHCLPHGPLMGGLVKIVQTPTLILILNEELNYRQIFLDGRELPKDPNPAWMGYSVGRWEGDTLVVESAGYNDRTWLELGYPHSENLQITERLHRDDFGHLTIHATYSDTAVFEKPWTAKTEMHYLPDTDLLEYVCAENEKDRVHLVGKNSDDLKNAVKVAPAVLSKYVGAYELPIRGDIQEWKVALEDGGLTVSVGRIQRAPMVALSETTFAGFGTHFEFGKNDKGEVTYLIIRAAEGDLRADRKN